MNWIGGNIYVPDRELTDDHEGVELEHKCDFHAKYYRGTCPDCLYDIEHGYTDDWPDYLKLTFKQQTKWK